MPKVIHTGYLNVRGDDGEYIKLNTVAEQTAQEQIAEIEAKGKEVRESIPSDYTALSNEVDDLKSAIEQIEPGLSDAAKVALLNCFHHVTWDDEHGQTYYDALESALYADQYPKITAVFNSGANVIYTDDTLDSLKQYLTVKYFETAESTGVVIASSSYNLSGTLTEGASTVLVSYDGLTTSFTIAGVVDFYNIWEWSTEYNDVGKLTKTSVTIDKNIDGVRRGYETEIPVAVSRFGVAVTKGKQPAINKTNMTPSTVYPVPIPKTATKVTMTVTPATDYLFGYVGRYEAGSQSQGFDYTILNESASWTHQGTYTCEFTAGENLFLGYNEKKGDNSNYTDADRAARVVTITFE